ncbi:MAG: cysteine desulfurase [Longimicrobiales bacterium]
MSATTTGLDVTAIRREFPILDQEVNGRPLTYLDSAASAQKPNAVIDAISYYYRHDNANVHRGLYDLSRRATDRFEAARTTMARFINAPEDAEVIFVRGATEGLNLVASAWGGANLSAGDEILLTVLEHHSNIVPWQLIAQRTGAVLRYLDVDDDGMLRLEQLDTLLTERTKVVAFNHISNSLGTINPVRVIADRAHAVGAIVVVDGAQGAPHVVVDVQALGADFYAISSHKMCGPMGAGVLWGRRELLDAMPPYHGGGEMIQFVYPDYSTYAPIPNKFEAGTPNVAGVIGMAAAADYLNSIGRDALAEHERSLVEYGLHALKQVPALRLFGPPRPEDRIAVFSFELGGVHPHDVATILDDAGIAVRAGHHCTQLLMKRLGVPATTRASCYLYNTTDDIDRLVEALHEARRVFAV